MIKAIVVETKPAFYCKTCMNASQMLFMDGDNRYCEHCASEEIKKKAVYFNQIGEQLEINVK